MNPPTNSPTFLIICRVENASSAPAWAESHGQAYDCLLSQYGANADPAHHFCAGGKWVGIYDLLSQRPELLAQYDYFWLPDDDIETTPQDIESFLRLCQAQRFELAQPALTPGSVYAYRLTLGNPRFQFRRTNFVELMMPLIERQLLQRLLPFFANRHAALGIDWMWHRLASKPDSQVAIVDAILMGHYRPRNKYLAGRMKKHHNIDILEERRLTMQVLKIKPLTPMAHQGRLINGQVVTTLRLAIESIAGYFSIRDEIKQHRWTWRNYLKFFACLRTPKAKY